MITELYKRFWTESTRYVLRAAACAFGVFSVIFTIARGITYFFPGVKFEGPLPFGAVFVASAGFGIWRAWKPRKTQFRIPNTNTTIEVLFGDLFAQEGIRAIAVSEYFESELGKPVSEKSLHGIFLKECFGGYPEPFDKQVAAELQGAGGEKNDSKKHGKTVSYPIGTSALVAVNHDRYLMFAFAKAEPDTCKVYTSVSMMLEALAGLWRRARTECEGQPLNVPLVGSGVSFLNLPARQVLDLILLSVITESKSKQITQKIRIILHHDRYGELDLRDVTQSWGQ